MDKTITILACTEGNAYVTRITPGHWVEIITTESAKVCEVVGLNIRPYTGLLLAYKGRSFWLYWGSGYWCLAGQHASTVDRSQWLPELKALFAPDPIDTMDYKGK